MADSGSSPPENPTPKHGSYANVTASTSPQSNLPFDPKRIVPIGTHKEKDGQQVIGFSSSENNRLAETWKLTLIGKFSFAIPHPKGIASGFSALNLKGPFSWSFANPSHIIIKLHLEEDYNKLWMGTLWSLGDCPMRVFKWTPSFNPRTEAPLAPVWIRLPGLPIHFFDHNALFAICKIIGTPLQVDSPTATRTRLSMARVCVELDLLKERVEEVILEFDGTTHVQKIVFERTPDYCLHCKHIGHTIEGCYMNGNKPRPPPPVRRPVPNSASDGQLLKGTSGNLEKLRGAGVISNNQAWIRVNKKGPRETGLVSKELLNIAKESKHTYFEANNSHIAESFSNQFSILENEVSQPLDALQKSIDDPDLSKGLQSDVATISSPKNSEDNRLKGSYPTQSLSSFEKNILTHGTPSHYNKCDNIINGSDSIMAVSARMIKGDNCGALSENIPPIISTATPMEGFIDQNCSYGNLGPTATTFHATKVVDEKHNVTSDIFINENISPSTSPSNAAPLNGVGSSVFLSSLTSSTNNSCLAPPFHPSSTSLVHMSPSHIPLGIGCPLNGNSQGPTPTPPLAQNANNLFLAPPYHPSSTSHAHLLPPHPHLGIDCPLNGNSEGPTPMPHHTQEVIDPLQHKMESDTINKHGPYPSFSPCVAPSNDVGPNVCLSPLHLPANNHILAPPHHSHSVASDTPRTVDASFALLGPPLATQSLQHMTTGLNFLESPNQTQRSHSVEMGQPTPAHLQQSHLPIASPPLHAHIPGDGPLCFVLIKPKIFVHFLSSSTSHFVMPINQVKSTPNNTATHDPSAHFISAQAHDSPHSDASSINSSTHLPNALESDHILVASVDGLINLAQSSSTLIDPVSMPQTNNVVTNVFGRDIDPQKISKVKLPHPANENRGNNTSKTEI
ncbi:hypothetical protein DH2020_047795 [Rehmannia glutinosa]|uniref:DUF4283 domain-containing protein n=1 Tax=Rehmannia glutinosa TaxID=99300 RepID=A0ABR0U7G7_REHGL